MEFEKLKNDMIMRKWISFLFLMMVGVGVFAQKSYVNVIGRPMYASNRGTSLSGLCLRIWRSFTTITSMNLGMC